MAIERTTYLKYRLHFPRIYRKDLEAIQRILLDAPKDYRFSLSYTIQASNDIYDEYKAEDIADIPEDISCKKLHIFGHYHLPEGSKQNTAYFTLWQDRTSIKINFTNPDTLLRGKFDEIKELLIKTEHPKLSFLLGHPWLAYFTWLASYWLVIPFLPRQSQHYKVHLSFIITCTISTLLFAWLIATLIAFNTATRLRLNQKEKSFLRRNKEQVIVGTTIAVLGSIIYGVITLMLGRIFKR